MPLRVQGTPGLTQPSTSTGRSRTGTHLSTNIYIFVDLYIHDILSFVIALLK